MVFNIYFGVSFAASKNDRNRDIFKFAKNFVFSKSMKFIIAGGRFEKLTSERIKILDSHIAIINEVVSGCASGIDTDAIAWAKSNNIPYKEFPAQWDDLNVKNILIKTNKNGKKYNAFAGFNRNVEMAKYADGLILFKGGSGTNHMFETAKKYHLVIHDHRLVH